MINWGKKMNDIRIRAMSIEDYDQIAQFWSINFGKSVSLQFDSRERIAAYLERNPGISTVAEIDQIIIGTVLCGHDGRRGTLYHVAVAEEHRRKGVAKEMVERSLSLLKEAGIHTAVLFAHSENVNAVTYWRHSGWTLFSNVLYHSREF